MTVLATQHKDCNDHWCENYGKGSGECDHCEKQAHSRDAPELRVYLQQRDIGHVEIDCDIGKTNGPER